MQLLQFARQRLALRVDGCLSYFEHSQNCITWDTSCFVLAAGGSAMGAFHLCPRRFRNILIDTAAEAMLPASGQQKPASGGPFFNSRESQARDVAVIPIQFKPL
jgi:hypothetical protein